MQEKEKKTKFQTTAELLGLHLKEFAHGQDNAKTAKDLRGFGKSVQIRQMVHRLRLDGEPICSSDCGYYYASSISDLDRTLANLGSRIKSIREAFDGLSKTKRHMLLAESDSNHFILDDD